MTEELAPCPFCGGSAKHYHRDDGSGWSNTDWVCCENEDCSCQTCLHETKEIAIAAWNRRPDPEQLVAKAIDAERGRCLKLANGWLIAYGQFEPQFIPAQQYACDAVSDIAELIQSGEDPFAPSPSKANPS